MAILPASGWAFRPLIIVASLLSVWLSSCATDAVMIREAPRGGTVAYSIANESEVLVSPSRAKALALVEQKCGRAYHILREGQLPRISKKVDQIWMARLSKNPDQAALVGEVSTELLWGLQFTCD